MVPKWSPDGPKSGLEGDWGAAGKAYVDQVAPRTGAGPVESKNDFFMVPFWFKIGPKMAPLATQNLDNCKGGVTKIEV